MFDCQDTVVAPANDASEAKSNIPVSPSNPPTAPIKILLFPPDNKKFRFDEITKSIEIEPAETVAEVVVSTADLTRECETFSQSSTPEKNKSGLTPLVEKCNLYTDITNSPQKSSSPTKTQYLDFKQIAKIENVFLNSRLKKDCFLKGCKWSGDGLCLLSNSEDNVLRIFEVSEQLLNNSQDNIDPVLNMKEGGTVYDYEWYPLMNSSDPISCVFVSTSQDSPIHLWDAYTGQLRATYQPINQYDEVTTAFSLAFTPDGSKLYSGFKKCLRIFDICQPGKVFIERNLKSKENPVFQSNIISTITINPVIPSLYALGSYDKTIGVYTEPEGDLLFILKGHTGGITHIKFSSDGNYLYSGGRKDHEILCWDIRNPGKVVFSIQRIVDTQQKIYFDISPDQKYLITGTTDCHIKVYDIKTSSEEVLTPLISWKGHEDCVNGVQFHPNLPLVASSSGQRHITPVSVDDDEDGLFKDELSSENSIKIWSYS